MTRPGKIAAVLALLATLVVGSPAGAQDYKELSKRIQDLEALVAKLQRDRDRDANLTNTELQLLTQRLNRMEDSLARLRNQTSTSRRAFSFDPDTRTVTGSGSIVIDNQLARPAVVRIDGVDYTVPAFGRRTLRDQPAGTILYSARASNSTWGAVRRSVVRAGEELQITVFDQ